MEDETVNDFPVWPDSDDTQADDDLPEGFQSQDDGI